MEPDLRSIAQHALLYSSNRQEALDAALLARLGRYRYSLDLAGKRLTFRGQGGQGGEVSGRADVIASVPADPQRLRWGWSPLLADVVGTDELAHRLRDHGRERDLPSLVEEEVPYEISPDEDRDDVISSLAHAVGRVAVEVLGPETVYYTFPTDGVSRAVVALRDLDLELPPIRLADVAASLGPEALALDDAAWALDGLAAMVPAWSARREHRLDGDVDVVADEEGLRLVLRTERDDRGRARRILVSTEQG
ncbi:hypothetical protein NLU66_06725 [Brachybacterium sp. NBEC-018]|uniref:DUF6882 domain-containing protein n=1 Tax=Brachybacterium sp. NBEC-018 TaxID=2996004 RepID=UPI002174D96B|nr:DUF6882 domain-containing protein [Brachybacterium sp. NBEC-018]UVY85283.1 hypothetical protein NLU66_06725 [Brachybacterium sp. NBEC-018]